MPLANTLGVCLLLLWPGANVVRTMAAISVWELTRPQESQSSDSSPQGSSTQAPTEPQKAPDQSTAAKPAAGTTLPCPKNSQPGKSTKAGCKPAATKAKKQPGTQKLDAPASTQGDTGPRKTVVQNGSTEDPKVNLSPDPSTQALQQSEGTKQLLASSEANLKKISGRPLSASQQDTIKQVQSYMDQAKNAADAGEVQRAYNLAVKANLLSAELTKGH
jgi:hypothetical protein